jgi:transcriptional antiterminator NusG
LEEPEKIEGEEEKKAETPVLTPSKSGIEVKCEDNKQSLIAGKIAEFKVKVNNYETKKDKINFSVNIVTPRREQEAPEWFIKISAPSKTPIEEELKDTLEVDFDVEANSTSEVRIEITAPHSVDYGERMNVIVSGASKNDPAKSDSETLTITIQQAVMALKTSIGHERTVADSVYGRTKRMDTGIYTILAPEKLKGYLLIETMDPDGLSKFIKGIKRARSVIEGEISFKEIDHFLTPKPLVAGIIDGDIVELIAGPFKGEKARVQQIDETKEEITVELFEAVVPIPITIRGDHVRVLQSTEKEKKG